MPKIAAFGLVRGYPKAQDKWRYGQLILRNCSILFQSAAKKEKWDLILFHEGNISRSDQFFLNFLAFGNISFRDIGDTFRIPRGMVHTGEIAPLGYSLMCRFQYYGVWKHLADYDVAMRVEEDCFLLRTPRLRDTRGYITAVTCAETHTKTNETLPSFLEGLGDAAHYTQDFPYTNFYITNPQSWLSKPVQEFLSKVAHSPMSIENRWGDIPVLGVALDKFKDVLGPYTKNSRITYVHLSHLAMVHRGQFRAANFVLDAKHPLRTLAGILGRNRES